MTEQKKEEQKASKLIRLVGKIMIGLEALMAAAIASLYPNALGIGLSALGLAVFATGTYLLIKRMASLQESREVNAVQFPR